MAERWRDIAGAVGHLEPGERNAITDVPGVLVGHSQSEAGEASGVTIVAPPVLPAQAGTSTVNGVGELTAKLEIDELGVMETPVYLCGSHAVGTVFQAAVTISGRQPDHIVLPVVGECDDGDMADSRKITAGDVERATEALGADVAEGGVGGGTGMSCYEFPGGIGTASRRVGEHHVGVLLMCNFGHREYLDVPGGPLPVPAYRRESHGSCIAVCATDAPLRCNQLKRLSLRTLLGLARTGSFASDGSGEIAIAFTTDESGGILEPEMNSYFAAAFEAAWESVYNCLVAARPGEQLDGTMQDEFPIEAIRAAAAA
jgi:D-aminopeptidase